MAEPDFGQQVAEELRNREASQPADEGFGQDVAGMLSRRSTNLTDEEFAAKFVDQPSIVGPEMSAGDRATLSLLGDTPEERQLTFKRIRPEGEMVQVPSTDIVLFRNSPDENFRPVDQGFLESLSQDAFAAFGRDMADFAGDVPSLVGEAVGLAAFRRPGGGRLITDLMRLGVGAGAGETGQQLGQTIAGTQRESFDEQASRVQFESMVSILGGAAGQAIGSTVQFLQGRQGLGALPGANRAQRATERLNAPPLMPIQASDVPAIRLFGRQAQALLPRINRYVNEQRTRTSAALRSLVDRKARQRFIPAAARAVDQANKDIVRFAEEATRHQPTSFRAAGKAMQGNIDQWWQASRIDVNNLYDAARSIEEPTFTTGGLRDTATDILRGTPVAQAEGAARRGDPINAELREVAQTVAGLPDELSGITTPDGKSVAATDQLRALRSRLFDLKTPGVGERVTSEHAQAQRLYSALTDTMRNPSNTNPEFRAAWRVADGSASRRFDTIDQLKAIDAVRRVTPTRLVQSLVRPGSVDELIVLQRTLGEQGMEPVRHAFKGQLMNDMTTVNRTLDGYDRDTLRLLLKAEDEKALRDFGKAAERLSQTNIKQAIENQTRLRGFINSLVNNQDTAGVDELFQLVKRQGGKSGEFGTTVRAGILDEIWHRSVESGKNGLLLNAKKLQTTLSDFEQRGLLQFLEIGEKRVLNDVNALQRFIEMASPDAGTSLQAASAVASARGIWNPSVAAQGVVTLIENATVGRLMTSPMGRRLLLGGARNFNEGAQSTVLTDFRNIRLAGAALAGIANESEGEQTLPREYEFLEKNAEFQ